MGDPHIARRQLKSLVCRRKGSKRSSFQGGIWNTPTITMQRDAIAQCLRVEIRTCTPRTRRPERRVSGSTHFASPSGWKLVKRLIL